MGRKRFQPEQIISKLREAEVLLAKGDTAGQVARRLGVSEQTYYILTELSRVYQLSPLQKAQRKENYRIKSPLL